MLARPLFARPLLAACSSSSRTALVTLNTVFRRTYVISVEPPVVFPKKPVPRVYSERKTFLYNKYTRLLEASTDSPLIFLQHTDFSIPRLIQLRKEIHAAAIKHATPATPSLASPTPAPVPAEPELPTLAILRSSLFGVALRNYSPMDQETAKSIAKMVNGGLAVLTLPNLNPPQLNAVLRALQRSVPPRKPKTPEEIAQEKKEAEAAFVPGRRPKRQRPIPVPDLKLVGALIEGRVFKAEGVQDVAKLPNLDTLRAQLIGLLSAPSAQLAAVLSQASGGKLARTLEGFKKSLEEGQNTPTEAP